MATLTSSYQYLSRSPVMTSTNGSLSYYLLLYGKTVPNNTTGIHTVTIKSVLASTTNNATYYYYTQAHSGTINGKTAFSGTNKPSDPWELSSFSAGGVTYKTGTLLGEGSGNVDCTNGQAKNITVSCSYTFNGNAESYTPAKGTSRTASATVTLSAIPRQATLLTAPAKFSDGENPTITFSNPSGNNVTSLEAAIYNDSGTQSYVPYKPIEDKTSGTYTFNLTAAEKQNLLNAVQYGNSVYVRFYIRTGIGGVPYVSDPIASEFYINDASPKITASVVDVNDTTKALTDDPTKLIKYYSNAQATMTVTPQKGAAIDENYLIIRNGNNTGYGYSHTFNNVESNVFTFSAEDNRGNISTVSKTPTMVNYVRLTCYLRNNRPDASGNMTVECEGDYFNGSFGAVSNTLTVQYRYKTQGGSFGQWQNMTVSKNGNWYGARASLDIPNFDYKSTYTFECRAIDKLETVTSTAGSAKSVPVFHWGENDFVFEVPVTFNGGDSPVRTEELLDLVYPVNSIVIRYDHLSPASIFGGTWTRVIHNTGGATFLYGCTSAGVIGECGGESTHTLTGNEMPSHTHSVCITSSLGTTGTEDYLFGDGVKVQQPTSGRNVISTRSSGGGAAHNNMPPYIKVSIWRRTA